MKSVKYLIINVIQTLLRKGQGIFGFSAIYAMA